MKPCLDCGTPTANTRCPSHQRDQQRRRWQRGKGKAYNNKAYKQYRDLVRSARSMTCSLCGKPGADSIDHVIPLAAGGLNVPTNWAPAHKKCNEQKGQRTE